MSEYENEVLEAINIFKKMKEENRNDFKLNNHLDKEVSRLCNSLRYVKQKGFFKEEKNVVIDNR